MSTPCNIIITENGIDFKSIYVHFDGYPSYMLNLLNNHYIDKNKIKKLISLGDASSLHESIECPDNHSFDSPKNGYSVFYHRDRGESLNISKFPELKLLCNEMFNYYCDLQQDEIKWCLL